MLRAKTLAVLAEIISKTMTQKSMVLNLEQFDGNQIKFEDW